jgi:hypothetical protein
MENIRKIMEIMDDDEMFPTRNEWAYIKISNELKKLHLKLQELSRRKELYSPATIDPSARVYPSAPSLIWRDLRRVRIRPLR